MSCRSESGRNANKRYYAKPNGKEKHLEFYRLRRTDPKTRGLVLSMDRATREKYKSRTDEQADADFARLRPDGKKCRMCGIHMDKCAYSRSRQASDGRQTYCSKNGCNNRKNRLKRKVNITGHWESRGIDPTKCIYCETGAYEELEHVMPRALGGSDELDNLAPACVECNRGVGGKFDKDPATWIKTNRPDSIERLVLLFPQIVNLNGDNYGNPK